MQQLYPRLVGNPTQREAYIHYYDSGNTALNPITKAPWNAINSTNWPIFSCTISKMDEPDFIDCVNTY